MDREMINAASCNINNLTDKLGEIVFDEINTDDNFTYDIGRGVLGTFSRCQTPKEFEIANDMLIAICGWSFETLIEMIKERDANDYVWESL